MIPVKEDRKLISSGSEESIEFGISAKDSVHIMGILRDTLYSDKIMAVLREIGANAKDANVAAGRGDVPIRVTLPTLADPTLRIRDVGPGLSLDDVRTVFSQYGASTKRDSNSSVGMLGIGSKSPFAYSDSFIVTSWHGGTVAIYNAVIDESGGGRIDLLDVSDCDPSETGVEVQMAVRFQDKSTFEDRARQLFVHFTPRPTINIELPPPVPSRAIPNGMVEEIEGWTGYGSGGRWTAVMGGIPYAIDLNQVKSGADGKNLDRSVSAISGTLYFEIGDLQVAASRESLKYSDSTRLVLIERLNLAVGDYVSALLENIDQVPNWEKRLRVRIISDRSLSVPSRFKSMDQMNVNVVPSTMKPSLTDVIPGCSFNLAVKAYNGKLAPVSHVPVVTPTRLIVRDDPRSLAGFNLNSTTDILVGFGKTCWAPASSELKRVMLELEGLISRNLMEGIPIVMCSSLPWSRPTSSDKVPVVRDKEKAKARSFVLAIDLARKYSHSADGPPSALWTPVDRTPSNDDVFVLIEGYRAKNITDFYDVVREDGAVLRQIGLELPPIIGYKTSDARPVVQSKCLGTEYTDWRSKGMIEMILGVKEVAETIRALSFTSHANYSNPSWFTETAGVVNSPSWVIDMLGADHPISLLAAEERSGRMVLKRVTGKIKEAAVLVRKNMGKAGDPAREVREALKDRYPLLSISGHSFFGATDRKLWIDYVRMVDSIKPFQSQEKQEEAA